jgi:uncharacterized membrane protein
MDLVRGATLVAATMAMGFMAGVFGHYAIAVMPGLRRTDDRTFVGAFQTIDRAIINGVFLSIFVGALVLTALGAVLNVGTDRRSVLWLTVTAFALYLAVFVITVRVNVPLNDEIKAAGDPDRITDLAAVRLRFGEDRWARWNVARALMSAAALGCLATALVQFGRSLRDGGA